MLRNDRHQITFAVGPDGSPASIDDVERGLACGCYCPACNAPLVAKKGERRLKRWHFAHASGSSCEGALESSIHIAVKEVILRERRMLIPPCTVIRYPDDTKIDFGWSDSGEYTIPPYRYTCVPELYEGKAQRCGGGFISIPAEPRMIEFDEVREEVQQGNIRPDLFAVVQGHRLYIEVAVTHPVDGEKLRRIRARAVAAIQISIPRDDALALDWERLRKRVVETTTGKAWVFNPVAETGAEVDFAAKAPVRAQIRLRKETAERIRVQQEALEARLAIEAERAEARRQEEEELHKRREEAQRQAQLAEQRRLAAEKLAIREAAAVVERERMERERAEQRRADQEAQAKLIERTRTLPPSDHYPLLARCPVIFIDLDTLLAKGGVPVLGAALGDTLCNLVVTSEIRYHTPMDAIIRHLTPLGGRPVSLTPIENESDAYGVRKREIQRWFELHEAEGPFEHYLIIDQGWFKFPPKHISIGFDGFTQEHVAKIERHQWCWRGSGL